MRAIATRYERKTALEKFPQGVNSVTGLLNLVTLIAQSRANPGVTYVISKIAYSGANLPHI